MKSFPSCIQGGGHHGFVVTFFLLYPIEPGNGTERMRRNEKQERRRGGKPPMKSRTPRRIRRAPLTNKAGAPAIFKQFGVYF